jgi:hypothetical protein
MEQFSYHWDKSSILCKNVLFLNIKVLAFIIRTNELRLGQHPSWNLCIDLLPLKAHVSMNIPTCLSFQTFKGYLILFSYSFCHSLGLTWALEVIVFSQIGVGYTAGDDRSVPGQSTLFPLVLGPEALLDMQKRKKEDKCTALPLFDI